MSIKTLNKAHRVPIEKQINTYSVLAKMLHMHFVHAQHWHCTTDDKSYALHCIYQHLRLHNKPMNIEWYTSKYFIQFCLKKWVDIISCQHFPVPTLCYIVLKSAAKWAFVSHGVVRFVYRGSLEGTEHEEIASGAEHCWGFSGTREHMAGH